MRRDHDSFEMVIVSKQTSVRKTAGLNYANNRWGNALVLPELNSLIYRLPLIGAVIEGFYGIIMVII